MFLLLSIPVTVMLRLFGAKNESFLFQFPFKSESVKAFGEIVSPNKRLRRMFVKYETKIKFEETL